MRNTALLSGFDSVIIALEPEAEQNSH